MSNNVPQHLHDHFVIRQKIWKRCRHKNQHFMGALVGREGTGKSWTALRIAELADPDFGMDKVLFSPEGLLERLNEGKVTTGDVYILDEAGVGVGNRTWYDREQVHFNQVLQVIRDHNAAVIFTLPRLSELDVQAQARLIGYWKTEEVNREQGYVKTRYKNINPDRDNDTNEIYKKYPRRYNDGVKYKVKFFRYFAPSDEIVEPYEEMKDEFQAELYEETLGEYGDDEEDSDQLTVKEIAEEIKENSLSEYVGVHGGNGMHYIDAQLIEVDYGISQRDAEKVKKLLDRDPDVDPDQVTPDQSTETASTA